MDGMRATNLEETWGQSSVAEQMSASLMTPLGVIEGEVLIYLEEHGATPMRRLTRELDWPASLVIMAVGALVRERLVRATQHELEVRVEIEQTWARPFRRTHKPAPKLYGDVEYER